MTTEQPQDLNNKLQVIPDDSTPNSSPVKVDKQVTKTKKKKTQALKNFLNQKKLDEIVAPTRKKSISQTQDVQVEETENCRVCFKEVMKKKNCGFCNYVVCNQHMRKKRKHPKSGKFVKICDDCEDKCLFEKYMKNELKAQEALQLQDMIIESKSKQISEVLNGKRTKMQLLMNKRGQIDEERRVSDGRVQQQQNQVRGKERKLQSRFIEVEKMSKQIQELQRNLPRPLEEDYKALTDENEKITKELVKYEKMCQQALKSKSKKEKQMYEQYYVWEEKQLNKQSQKPTKKEDCTIF